MAQAMETIIDSTIPFAEQQFIDQLHSQYINTISELTIENAKLLINVTEAANFDEQKFINQLHIQYMSIITSLMQESARIAVTADNAQVLITELKAKVEALSDF